MTPLYKNAQQSWFSEWLSRAWPRTHRFIFNEVWLQFLPFINVAGAVVAVAAFIVALATPDRRPEYLFYVNDIGHLVLLLIALTLFLTKLGTKRPYHKAEEGDPISKPVAEFKSWLNILVVLWLAFYLARTFVDAPTALKLDGFSNLSLFADRAADYLNTFSALALFGLYIIAEHAGVATWTVRDRLTLAAVFIVLGSTVQILAHFATETHKELDQVAGIVNGLIVGIATALLVGRLDSRYIGLPKATVIFLYLYALIQPLFPYIFENSIGSSSGLRLVTQYVFVAMALVMKFVLIYSLGRIIDTGTLHFYINSMQWIDQHVGTLRIQYQRALGSGEATEGGPYLLGLVPPGKESARINLEKQPDIRVQLGVINAWLGVSWDIKELTLKEIQISDTIFKVKKVNFVDDGAIQLTDKQRFLPIELDIDLDLDSAELKERLRKDTTIADALTRKEKIIHMKVVLNDLNANTALLNDNRHPRYFRHKLESVDFGTSLFYKASLAASNLE